MQRRLADIAKAIGGRVVGDSELLITGVSGIKEAKEGDLTFLANPKYLPLAGTTQASAIIVAKDVAIKGKSVIQSDNPSLAFATVVAMIKDALTPRITGIHPSAIISKDARIADDVGVGPCVVIEPGVTISSGSTICAGVYIGAKTRIGEQCLIYPNVTIREDVEIKARVIVHSGSVIGSDGYGYAQVGDEHVKIPQTGIVVVEDDVEIGANVTIDRARFDKTVIGQGTKIDNLVQIAHNVRIGKNCLIIAQVGIAGSTMIGDNVIVAGQAGVAGHLKIGDRSIVAAQAGVSKDLPGGLMVSGTPADDHRKALKAAAHVARLADYIDRIKELESKVRALEERAGDP